VWCSLPYHHESYFLVKYFHASVAQWIEQLPSKQWVAGSIPARRASRDGSSKVEQCPFKALVVSSILTHPIQPVNRRVFLYLPEVNFGNITKQISGSSSRTRKDESYFLVECCGMVKYLSKLVDTLPALCFNLSCNEEIHATNKCCVGIFRQFDGTIPPQETKAIFHGS
jgi:hypothetical protein